MKKADNSLQLLGHVLHFINQKVNYALPDSQ